MPCSNSNSVNPLVGTSDMMVMRTHELSRLDSVVRWQTSALVVGIGRARATMAANVVGTRATTTVERATQDMDALCTETLHLVGGGLGTRFGGLNRRAELGSKAAEDGGAFGGLSIEFG